VLLRLYSQNFDFMHAYLKFFLALKICCRILPKKLS